MRPGSRFLMLVVFPILIHASTRDATFFYGFLPVSFNPRTREGCDRPLFSLCTFLSCILIHASARDATAYNLASKQGGIILIHASMRDATVKSYKIGNNFAALFRKFIQKLGIVIFRISIFLEE